MFRLMLVTAMQQTLKAGVCLDYTVPRTFERDCNLYQQNMRVLEVKTLRAYHKKLCFSNLRFIVNIQIHPNCSSTRSKTDDLPEEDKTKNSYQRPLILAPLRDFFTTFTTRDTAVAITNQNIKQAISKFRYC